MLDGPGLGHDELIREEILLAVPLGHRLAGRREVTMADLAGEPVVTTRPGIWQRTPAERLFSEAGLELVVACEIDEATTGIEMVSAGLGGVVPPFAAGVASAVFSRTAGRSRRRAGPAAVLAGGGLRVRGSPPLPRPPDRLADGDLSLPTFGNSDRAPTRRSTPSRPRHCAAGPDRRLPLNRSSRWVRSSAASRGATDVTWKS
ncbi:LysR substrate-binding domain-containing protein [Streptosporangium canum]|uniref:LysR substrate-binding domain-containing protein n=1 Tax=Streptosporangium canum TaxID=324952 RepID=UPI0036A036E4